MSDATYEIISDWIADPADPDSRVPRAGALLAAEAIGWGSRIDADGSPRVFRLDGEPIPATVIEAMSNG